MESLPSRSTPLPPFSSVLAYLKPPPKTDETASAILASPLSKASIRTSLKASTVDGIFAAVFSCVTAEALLSNFLLKLGATSLEIGFLAAIPLFVNFLQPLGAYLADQTTSRRQFNLWVFGSARLMWLILVLGIVYFPTDLTESHQLVQWTLIIVLVTHICNALGSASWLSWMAQLVPHRLRGRYFGLRNSAASLTGLLCAPLLAQVVSRAQGGTVQGYGLVLILAVLAGLISLSFQLLMADVNPQATAECATSSADLVQTSAFGTFFNDANFVRFLLYQGLWMFAVNLSLPFFNVYLLKDLNLDISWVTAYNSLSAGANVLGLVMWGKLADRIGNRPILFFVGMAFTVLPVLWLTVGIDALSLWLWLPALYLLAGFTGSAIDLANNNLQMELAPHSQSSSYFAMAAAVGGLCGALGTTTGGMFIESAFGGGIIGLFVLSSLLRFVGLFPLIFVYEPRGSSLVHLLENLPFLKKILLLNK